MSVSCVLQGRLANNIYQVFHMISYAINNGFDYYIPDYSPHTDTKKIGFNILSTGKYPINPTIYTEPRKNNIPYYHEMLIKDNQVFKGYWQSFRYLDHNRDRLLDIFNLAYIPTPYVGIHIRRGDYLKLSKDFPVLNIKYYINAVEYFTRLGYTTFKVFSDDIEWCKKTFTNITFPGCFFIFSEGYSEIEDLSNFSSCRHQIVANSSYSFMGAWLNRNPEKIVLCPDEAHLFTGHNLDFIPNYFTKISI